MWLRLLKQIIRWCTSSREGTQTTSYGGQRRSIACVPIVSHTDWSTLKGRWFTYKLVKAAFESRVLMPYTSMGQKFSHAFRVVVYDITTKSVARSTGRNRQRRSSAFFLGDPNDRALGQIITGDLGDRHQLFRAGDACPQRSLHDNTTTPLRNTSPQLRRMLGVFRGDLAEGDANIKGGRAQGALSTPSRQFANWGYSSDKGGIQKDRDEDIP
ncbi:hypothetical protein NFJ02_14g17820 [Pycnococcus provasolii]